MNPIFSRIKVWVSGEVLYASDLNNEFNNLLVHMVPTGIAGASQTVATMQQETSPGGLGTESLATDLFGELQRLRYVIARIVDDTQATFWYVAAGRGLGAGQLNVQSADIGAKQVKTANIDDQAVTTAQLADNSVTTAKIVNGAVTRAKLDPALALGASYVRGPDAIAITSFSTSFFVDIPNAVVTITTQGGAVKLFFTPGGSPLLVNGLALSGQGSNVNTNGLTGFGVNMQGINNGTGKALTATFAASSSTITVSSATGLYKGMPIRDVTTPANIQTNSIITNISGTTVTLSLPTTGASAGGGDAIVGGTLFTSVFSTGAATITASTTIGLYKGMQLVDATTPGNFAANTFITNISGSVITLSAATTGNSAGSPGDSISGTENVIDASGLSLQQWVAANPSYTVLQSQGLSAYSFIDERVRGYPGTYSYKLKGFFSSVNFTTSSGGLTGNTGATSYIAAAEIS